MTKTARRATMRMKKVRLTSVMPVEVTSDEM